MRFSKVTKTPCRRWPSTPPAGGSLLAAPTAPSGCGISTRRDARRIYRNNSDFISALAFSPDGTTLATGSLDGTIKVLSINSYRMQRIAQRPRNARITSLAFSSYDDLLASASEDGVVRLRSLKRPRAFLSLPGIGSGAKMLAFTNDGRTLVTGGQDGVVRLWSLPDRRSRNAIDFAH